MVNLSKPYMDEKELNAVKKVLESGWLAHGPVCRQFEEVFAEYIGVKHAITLNSCTSAIHLAVQSMGIKGEVIVPSFTFSASANAVVTAGAKVTFCDIEEDTCNMDPSDFEKKITKKTEAVMPVHFAGHPCDMEAIKEIADNHGLKIIEDSAECIGGKQNGKVAGSFGDAGCFSFFPTKNITTGEGGMLTTDDDDLAEKARMLKGHGMSSTTYEREKKDKPWLRASIEAGYNFRMSDVNAAIGVEQMKKIEKMNGMRIESAGLLTRLLKDTWLSLPAVRNGYRHVYQMYTIKLPEETNRTSFISRLREKDVQASVHFDPPVHLQPYYNRSMVSFPVTDSVYKRIVTLPMYAGMKKEDTEKVADAVKNAMQ